METNKFNPEIFRGIIIKTIPCSQAQQDQILYFLELCFKIYSLSTYSLSALSSCKTELARFDMLMDMFLDDYSLFLLTFPDIRYVSDDIEYMTLLTKEFYQQFTGNVLFNSEFKLSNTYRLLILNNK